MGFACSCFCLEKAKADKIFLAEPDVVRRPVLWNLLEGDDTKVWALGSQKNMAALERTLPTANQTRSQTSPSVF